MWFWILVCLLLSLFVIGFFGWSLYVLHQQKAAWKALAERRGLTYKGGAFTDSPTLRGKIDGFTVGLYTDAKPTNDIRGQRYVTAIDVELGQGMPTGAAIATKEMKPFVDQLVFSERYQPDHPEWDKDNYILRTRAVTPLKTYLTRERLETLCKLFKIKNAVTLFFFDELEAVLHIETPNPLTDIDSLEKRLNGFIRACKILALTDEEKAQLPSKEDRQKEVEQRKSEKAAAEDGQSGQEEPDREEESRNEKPNEDKDNSPDGEES